MTLYGFSRKDVTRQLSDFAKKDLIAGYPTDDVLQHGLGEFTQGHQTATDMELYAFISPMEIPAAVPELDGIGQVRMQAAVSPQRCKIYKPYPRSRQGDVADNQEVDVEVIQTGKGAAGGTNYGDAEYYVYNTFPKPIPKDTIFFCAVFGGVLFVVDRPPERRVRFRLLTSFNDTGYAQARVLDAFGDVGLSYNDIIEVFDPRKLFAHAIGSNEFTSLQESALNMDDMLHAGGSVGYAVYTYETRDNNFQCYTGCTQSNAVCYPRYEVEQCTQTVNRMRVTIDRYDDFPRGENPDEVKSLRVYPNSSFASQWPYVDFPKDVEVIPNPEGEAEYRISVKNPHRFSAKSGWAIIERVDFPSRLQNADNRCVPYVGGLGNRSNEWHIVDVENPIARWICATWQESTADWDYTFNNYYEGVEPSAYFEDPNDGGVGISDSIKTMPCTPIDCLKNGQPGVGFWDPNNQEYYITTTISAMYGQAVPYEVVGIPYIAGQESGLIGYGEDCGLNYKTRRNVRIFGDEDACDVTEAEYTETPSLEEVEVVVDVERSSMYMCHNPETGERIFVDNEEACNFNDGVWAETEAFCFDKKKVYVCNSADVASPTCLDICCDAPEPPPTECIECSQCPDDPVRFSSIAISWENVISASNNAYDGRSLNDSAVWTQQDDCCVLLSITLESDDPAISPLAATATVCIEPAGGNCMMGAWQLSLQWTPATFAGATLPTTLCGGPQSDCAGDYGNTGGSGVFPTNPSGGGNWGEADISVAACDP